MDTEYSDRTFRSMMCKVIYMLESAGHERESEAVTCLTNIISSRLSPPDISHEIGSDYLLDCIMAQHHLLRYIDIEDMDFQRH